MAKTTYLVSKKFEAFCTNEDVMTYEHLLGLIGTDNGEDMPECIVIGQGLDRRRVDHLTERMKQQGMLDSTKIIWPNPHAADLHLIHKHNPDNAMITVPRQNSNNRYSAALIVSDSCAEMSDHVTGQHIQGTVLLEAARQMMMASVEIHAFTHEQRGQYGYVLNELQINYFQYAFPVAIDISLDIESCDIDEKGMLTTKLVVSFYQAMELVCQVRCIAQGYRRALLARLEARAAKLHLRQLRQQHLVTNEPGECQPVCQSGQETRQVAAAYVEQI